MFNIFSLIPFILILGFSLTRNLKQKTLLPKEVAYHTVFQSVIAYLFVVIFFFQGFIFNLYVIFIIVPLVVIIGLFYFFNNTDDVFYLDGILRLEAIKNNIIFILITILPFYVFMTVFRFSNGFIQIFLSVILTLVIFIASILLKEKLERHFSDLGNYLSTSGPMKYVGLWVFILVILIFSIFFQLPTNKIRQSLNLSNSSGYYVFDGLPTNVQTNFIQEQVFEIDIKDNGFGAYKDYYYNNQYFYLYKRNEVMILNRDRLEVEKQMFFNDSIIDFELVNPEGFSAFIVHEDYLLLNSLGAVYIVDGLELSIIKVFDKLPTIFYNDNSDDLFFLIQTTDKEYEVYRFNSGTISLVESIDLRTSTFDSLEVVNNKLFYVKEDTGTYFLYDTLDISKEFSGLFGELIYDSDNSIFYMANPEGYFYNDGNGNVKLLDSFKVPASKGVLFNGLIYYFDNEYGYGFRKPLGDSRVIIINPETKEVSLFNHLETHKFLRDKDYISRTVVNYKVTDSGIEFVQTEVRYGDSTLNQIFLITEKPVANKLPFYSHYDIYIFIWLLVGLLIPITDNIKYITYIDFASVTKNDDE